MNRSRQGVINLLQKVLGEGGVATDDPNRILYSRDMMTGTTLDMKAGKKPLLPDIVCWPSSIHQVAQVVRIAAGNRIPVIPYGGGSGVSGGTLPIRGGIILDLKRLNRIEKIEEGKKGYFAVIQSGIIGEHLERELNGRGFTLGHFPSSILCATLGGYLAARSAGQLSSKYGKIEDMVDEVEVVLPDGSMVPFGGRVRQFPGVLPRDIFVGSEGCLGTITKARLKIHPLPPVTRYRGVSFNRLEDALTSIRKIMQKGLRPSVVRLYDPLDTLLLQHGYENTRSVLEKIPFPTEFLKKRIHRLFIENAFWVQKLYSLLPSEVLLILAFEGEEGFAEAQEKLALAICRRFISRDLGEKPGLHWLKHRYSVSFKMPQFFTQDCFVDTIEVAATWDRLLNLYKKMKEAMERDAMVLAHFSHAYPEGCSIYFTVIGRTGSPETDRKLYNHLWEEAMESCLAAGGTISHHHGIGILKAKYLPRELGGAMKFFREMKKKLDPRGILNPGKMGL